MLSSPDLELPQRWRWLRLPSLGRGNASVAELVAGGALVLVVLVAVLGPVLSPYDPIVPSGATFLAPGSAGHLLGTDNLGFDMLSRILSGLRMSLFAAVVVTALSALFGLLVGTLAGFFGGWLDSVLMRLTDLFLAFPATIVAMAIAASLGPSLRSSMIGIGVVWWPMYARLVRGEVRRTAAGLHVEAARMAGVGRGRLMVRHVVPAVLPSVVVTASLDIGAVIMTIAGLSFIGLGSPAPAPELGLMASAGMQYVLTAWWVAVLPGAAVGLLALLFNYVGDGLRVTLRSRGV